MEEDEREKHAKFLMLLIYLVSTFQILELTN